MQPYGAKMVRATVDQNIRVVLDAVPDHWRSVQVQAPVGVQASLDTFDLTAGITIGRGASRVVINQSSLVPRYYGHNRNYKLPPFYPISNKFHIAPGQCIVACAAEGYEILVLIVEWAPTPSQ
jgi:hypothetical protein